MAHAHTGSGGTGGTGGGDEALPRARRGAGVVDRGRQVRLAERAGVRRPEVAVTAPASSMARQRRAFRPAAERWQRRGVLVQLDLGGRSVAAAGPRCVPQGAATLERWPRYEPIVRATEWIVEISSRRRTASSRSGFARGLTWGPADARPDHVPARAPATPPAGTRRAPSPRATPRPSFAGSGTR